MLPLQINELIEVFNNLPGLGKKGSQKVVLDILNLDEEKTLKGHRSFGFVYERNPSARWLRLALSDI